MSTQGPWLRGSVRRGPSRSRYHARHELCRLHATAKVMPSPSTESLHSFVRQCAGNAARSTSLPSRGRAHQRRACLARRVLSHAPRENTRSFARRPQRNTRQFWRVHEASRAGIAVAISRRVTARTSQGGSPNGDCRVDDDVRGDGYARAHNVCAVSGAKCSGGLCRCRCRAVCCPRK